MKVFSRIESAGILQREPMILAQWMIATETGCCLRSFGIVMDEQRCLTVFLTANPGMAHNIPFSF
jgi:hypothetical protein